MLNIPITISKDLAKKYIRANNTFSRDVKTNPKDRISVEIGDSKNPEFKPQIKIMRWDNEVNFSVRAEEHPDAQVRTEGEIVKYITPDYEVHQYDKPDAGEDGGFEFEWVLPKKPASNVLAATIQTKGLNFFYQPPLTQEKIDEGAERPENVVGSYAVYHATKGGMNDAAGMEYKVGKFCHIYRPKVTDADGNETWGELQIDEQSGLLTVTIDQTWLDNAVYPVVVDPTFGYTTQGSSGSTQLIDDIYGSLGTVADGDGLVDSISFCLTGASGDDYKGIVVNQSDLTIATNGISDPITVGSNTKGFYTATFTNKPSVVDATQYYVSMITNGISNTYHFDVGGTNFRMIDNSNSYTTPTDPTDGSITNFTPSIYATYTAGGGTQVNDERDAHLTGSFIDSDERSGHTTGDNEYSREQNASLPTDDSVLSNLYSSQERADVASSDDARVIQTGATGYVLHQYRKLNTNNTDDINATWEGQSTVAPSSATVALQIYNYNSTSWENVDTESAASANTDFTLSGSITSSQSDYYGPENEIAVRVYQQIS